MKIKCWSILNLSFWWTSLHLLAFLQSFYWKKNCSKFMHTLVALDCSASSLTFLSSSSKSWIFCCSFDLTACKDLISSRNISCSLHAWRQKKQGQNNIMYKMHNVAICRWCNRLLILFPLKFAINFCSIHFNTSYF